MRIKELLVERQGWLSCNDGGDFELFYVGGEMGNVQWYRQKLHNGEVREIQGKYIIRINYFADDPITNDICKPMAII